MITVPTPLLPSNISNTDDAPLIPVRLSGWRNLNIIKSGLTGFGALQGEVAVIGN
jgi:hypothetical protein